MPVTLVGVSHSFERKLFAAVDHEFAPGRITGIVGPSGCGKSTLLAIVSGMIQPTAGHVDRAGARCVWVFQNPHGVARRSARDHVSLPFLARGLRRRDADAGAERLLQDFGLGSRADVAFSALSGGEAQRLMLARAVAAAPELLLVDEPTAQLDREMAKQVNTVIARLADDGAAVAIATHDAETRRACDDVIDLSTPPKRLSS